MASMLSIFDLKTEVSQLSSANQGISRMQYDQHPPTRDVTGTNFPNGAIHFRFQTNGTKWFMPSRSYIRIRGSLSKAAGGILTPNDGIAPNMGIAGSLFQSLEFRLNDKTISRVSDFVPQVDALETRLTKSRSWLNGIGNSVNFWDDDFKTRQSDVTIGPLNDPIVTVTERVALGFDVATNTVAVTADTGVITFAQNEGKALPTLANIFQIGDEIEITSTDGNIGTVRYRISKLIDATTIQANNLQTIEIGAGPYAFRRIRSNSGRNLINFEITWTPPLSIFKIGHGLPSGKFELILNPQTSSVYKKYAIESIVTDKIPGVDYNFSINDMYFYANTVEGERADDITYLLDLEQTRCQTETINPNGGMQQKNFDVSPSTYALTVAYQDSRAGTNTQISSSKFKSYNALITTSEELKLRRFFINYAGQNLPSPDADPLFVLGDDLTTEKYTDYTTQRYIESQIYSGAYFDTGGAESLKEFHNRGSYYYVSIPRDGTDRSTRVTINQEFRAADLANTRVLLFDHAKQIARIRVQDGRVIDVQIEDA